MSVLSDKMNQALYPLVIVAPNEIFQAVVELRNQGYTTPAANLQLALDALKVATAAAQAAVASGTLG